jgi:hypothetical protein
MSKPSPNIRGAKPYLLIVGLLALLDAIFGRQIQAWIMTLPQSERGLPFLAVVLIGLGTLLAYIYRATKV